MTKWAIPEKIQTPAQELGVEDVEFSGVLKKELVDGNSRGQLKKKWNFQVRQGCSRKTHVEFP